MRLLNRISSYTVVLIFLLSASDAAGQNWFEKYMQDQPRKSVRPVDTVLLGNQAQSQLELSERNAIEMALRYNLDVNIERHEPIFTFWEPEIIRGVYDPRFRFGFNWHRQTTPSGNVLSGGLDTTDILTSYDFAYQQRFSQGASIEVAFNGNRDRTTNFFASVVPAINTLIEVRFRQNLLKGFGKIDPEYDIEIANTNIEISTEDFRRQIIDLVFEVQRVYWDLEFALQDIRVREQSLELAEAVLAQNQARFEVGNAARLEVIQAEAEHASRKEELIRARYNYRLIQDELVSLITSYEDPREIGLDIIPSEPVYTPDPITESFPNLQQVAERARPELEIAELNSDTREVVLERTRNQLKPSLDMVLGYQQFGLGGNTIIRDFDDGFIDPPIIAVIPGGLGDSFNSLFTGGFYGYTVGLELNIPLSNVEARAQNARAQIDLDRSRLEIQRLRQGIAVQVREALTAIELNEASLEASDAAVRLGVERLEGEQARFDVGIGTTRQLIEAQRDLVQAESVRVRAQIDLIKSHAFLEKALGTNLERRRISIADVLAENVAQ